MAAELIVEPGVSHSFLHDLESTYFILLFHCITNMKHGLSKGAAANLFHDVLDSRHYTQDGEWQKYGFMLQKKWISKYNIPSNRPFTSLICNLHSKFKERYWQLELKEDEDESKPSLPSFIMPAECMATNFGYDVFIEIFDKQLGSSDWPAGDKAISQRILNSNSNVTLAGSGLKRGIMPDDDSGTSTGKRNCKWRYQSLTL